MKASSKKTKLTIGWREWCALPELTIPAIKAKIDTGARTSALHAFNIRPFSEGGTSYVQFEIHPMQRNRTIAITHTAPVIGTRLVKNSGGVAQRRYVIRTTVKLGDKKWPIEVTLTNRDSMGFRMLLGREALKRRVTIEPGRSFLQGRLSATEVQTLYRDRSVFLY